MAMKAPLLGKTGSIDVEDVVFGAEVKPHLVHEAVRAEQNAQRAGTAATKSRGSSPADARSPGARRARGAPARARSARPSSPAAVTRSPRFRGRSSRR